MSSDENSAAAAASSAGTKRVRTARLPRDAAWVASLRNVLSKYNPWGRVTSAAISGAQHDAELDGRLNKLWERYAYDDGDAPSTFAKKIAELKSFYEQKLQEIARKEAEYTSEQGDPRDIKKEIKRLQFNARHKFSRQRLKLKKEVLKTIGSLRDKYADKSKAKRNLPSDAKKAMNIWLQSHSSNPYPSDAEKEAFAAQYSITIEQVTTWFTNKRYRSQRQH